MRPKKREENRAEYECNFQATDPERCTRDVEGNAVRKSTTSERRHDLPSNR